MFAYREVRKIYLRLQSGQVFRKNEHTEFEVKTEISQVFEKVHIHLSGPHYGPATVIYTVS